MLDPVLSPSIADIVKSTLFFAGIEAQRYLFLVALGFAGWWWWRNSSRHRKLQAEMSAPGQIRREVFYSFSSLLIFGIISVVILAVGGPSEQFFYEDIATYGWPYFFASIAIMILIQDTYFYWTHRLMHHRALFRIFHRTHHLSINPTPWSTYAINPLEAVIDSGPTVLIFCAVPKHLAAYLIFLWFNTAYAVYGHLGYEIFPRGLPQHWLGRWINSSVAHNTHHAKARYNYGWYFLFWDRLMGTLDPRYPERYGEATAAAPAPEPSSYS